MDFFDRQEKARKKTKLLVCYFALALVGIALAIYVAIAGVFLARHADRTSTAWLWNGRLFCWVLAGTGCVIAGGTLFKVLELRQGGAAVATALGGQLIDAQTSDPDERKVLNVVEEMAIAAGLPVPPVYLLAKETGINAFAAGSTATDAVVGVSRGCVAHLTRAELQGVEAHEFSHILNGDMRLNLRLIGLLSGILGIALIGRLVWDVTSRSSGRARALSVIGLALLAIGSIGVFFGRLIKSAVSRQREFLADAAAVQFTRDPGGLAGALKKIGGLGSGSRVRSPMAEEASHLFFSNALSESWIGLFSTHPPLVERILALDPTFDGRFTQPPPLGVPLVDSTSDGLPVAALTGAGTVHLTNRASARVTPVPAASVLQHAGLPQPAHLEYAAGLLARLPPTLAEVAHEPFGATALVYCLALGEEPRVRASQLAQLEAHAPAAICEETRRLLPEAAGLAPAAKLALVDVAIPALRRLSPDQYAQFAELVRVLIEADRQIDLFEYTLQKLLRRRLEPQFRRVRPPAVQYYSLRPVARECAVLVSALVHVGQGGAAGQQAAFRLAARALGPELAGLGLLPPADAGLAQVDAALDQLALVSLPLRRKLIEACAAAVAADGLILEAEAELVRAMADTLDCPLPPFVQPNALPAA